MKTANQLREFINLTWPEPVEKTFPWLVLRAFDEMEATIARLTRENGTIQSDLRAAVNALSREENERIQMQGIFRDIAEALAGRDLPPESLPGLVGMLGDKYAKAVSDLVDAQNGQEQAILNQKLASLAERLTAAEQEAREARRNVRIANANIEDVWMWQGAGDDPDSLTCPVVMSADTLRNLLTRIKDSKC